MSKIIKIIWTIAIIITIWALWAQHVYEKKISELETQIKLLEKGRKMIVRTEDKDGEHVNFHEGKHVGYHWREETDDLTKALIIVVEDSDGKQPIQMVIEPSDNIIVYLMNDNGKTIDKLRVT